MDRKGAAYIAGTAGPAFVTTAGAYQSQLAMGTGNALFAAKINDAGSIEYATYAGDGGLSAIAVDSKGGLWMVGSASVTIDVSGGPYYVQSCFIQKLDPAGATLPVSTGFGAAVAFHAGISSYAYDVAVDKEDSAYVVGSAAFLVPVTPGVLEPDSPGGSDIPQNTGYVVKYSASGSVLYGTYLGGTYQAVTAVAVDDAGDAVVALTAGQTPNLNTPCGYSTMVQVLNPSASAVLTTVYLLSRLNHLVFGPANWQPRGHGSTSWTPSLYAAGGSTVLAFFATPGAYQTVYDAGDPSKPL